MKLYYAETLNPRKVCALAKHLGAPVEYIRIDLGRGEQLSPAFKALNPNGKVPVLEDGGKVLWESNAIMCHLARAAGSDLWPTEAEQQAEVLRWLSWNSEHFTQYAGTLYFENLVKARLNLGEPDKAAVEEAKGYVRKYGAILDMHLRGRRYLLGDRLSLADFAVAVTLPYAADAGIPVEDFAEIQRWHGELNELPGWREPFPEVRGTA